MIILLFIITIPAFRILLNNYYLSIHDDQHIVRLYLLNQGISQGIFFPRWTDGLGFGFGYPLYNFYPPLVYYLAEFFHILGFSLIWSIKLVIIIGFIVAALGIFLFLRQFVSKWAALLGATIYTYFFYHAVLIYVRGALAEFFSLAVIPFVFLGLYKIYKHHHFSSALFFGIFFAVIILTHPLIAFPTIIFIGLFFLFFLFFTENRVQFIGFIILGLLFGLSLSSFFWLPAIMEKKFTLTDEILTKELANYKLHYIYPKQFWYSSWGYGGSVAGLGDGLTFQLGKIPIFLSLLAIVFSFFYLIGNHLIFWRDKILNKRPNHIEYFYFFLSLLLFSLWMTTQYSSFIWDNIQYLWYLQFPWRFLTFATFFISVVTSYSVFFLERFLSKKIVAFLVITMTAITVIKYQNYFRPQQLLITNDSERTSFEEVAWRISRTSYEFVPKGVKTKKTDLGTTVLAIEKKDLPKKPYEIILGKGEVELKENKFNNKVFKINAQTPIGFRLNTYNFPGWRGYLDKKEIKINDQNEFKLITVYIPKGKYQLEFKFEDTLIRKAGNFISIATFFLVFILYLIISKNVFKLLLLH